MTRRRTFALLSAPLLAASLLGGCSGFGGAHSCVDWVSFEGPQSLYDGATHGVVGTAAKADGTVQLISGPGDRHPFAVEEVLKGDLEATELAVAAPRDYCVENPPEPADDPIPTGERVVLFLSPADGEPDARVPADLASVHVWRTLTSREGVLPLGQGEELPFDTER
jgi:hypothetical protein